MTPSMDRIWSAVVFALLALNNVNGQRRGQYGAGVTQATEFDCPEEFGYYPHPSDCTQYYVCVFGGALLESCTGGLMYSHELQTCDWPRNVGCGADNTADSVTPTPARSAPPAPRSPIQQHRSQSTLAREQQQQERQQRIQQEEIAKQLYAEDLGPAEEVESDRQQRVYRGQPSSLGQVARDRDGLRHQPNTNTIQAPSTSRDKVSVISYATQPPPQYSGDPLLTRGLDVTFENLDNNLLHSETYKRRKKRHTLMHRPEPSAAPLQYSPQPPQPQPSPTTGRSVFAHPANTSYQPNNYDQYYAVYDDDDQLYRDVDYGHYQNGQSNSPQPFSRGNSHNRQEPQNVEIVSQQQQQQPQQQQRQPNNAFVSSSYNVQSQDVYSPTVPSQDYNDNYNAHVNVQYDVDDTFPQTKPSSPRHPNGLKRQIDQGSRLHTNSAQDYFNPSSSPFPFPNYFQTDRFVPPFPSFQSNQHQRSPKLEPENKSNDRLTSKPVVQEGTISLRGNPSTTRPSPSAPSGTNRDSQSYISKTPQNFPQPFAFPEKSFSHPATLQPFSSLQYAKLSGSRLSQSELTPADRSRAIPSSTFSSSDDPKPTTPVSLQEKDHELLQPPKEVRILPKSQFASLALPQLHPNHESSAYSIRPSPATELRIVAKSPSANPSEVRILPKPPPTQKSEASFREEFSRYNYYDTSSKINGTPPPNIQSSRWVPLEVLAGFFQHPKQSLNSKVEESRTASPLSPLQGTFQPLADRSEPKTTVSPVALNREPSSTTESPPPKLIRFPNSDDGAPPTRLIPPTQTHFQGFNNAPSPSFSPLSESRFSRPTFPVEASTPRAAQQEKIFISANPTSLPSTVRPQQPLTSPRSTLSLPTTDSSKARFRPGELTGLFTPSAPFLLDRSTERPQHTEHQYSSASPIQDVSVRLRPVEPHSPFTSSSSTGKADSSKFSQQTSGLQQRTLTQSTAKPVSYGFTGQDQRPKQEQNLVGLEFLTVHLPKRDEEDRFKPLEPTSLKVGAQESKQRNEKNFTSIRAPLPSQFNSTLASVPDYYYEYEYDDYLEEPYEFVSTSTERPEPPITSTSTTTTQRSTTRRNELQENFRVGKTIQSPKIGDHIDILPTEPTSSLHSHSSTPTARNEVSHVDASFHPSGNKQRGRIHFSTDNYDIDVSTRRSPVSVKESPLHPKPVAREASPNEGGVRKHTSSLTTQKPFSSTSFSSEKSTTSTEIPSLDNIVPRTYRPSTQSGRKRVVVRHRPRNFSQQSTTSDSPSEANFKQSPPGQLDDRFKNSASLDTSKALQRRLRPLTVQHHQAASLEQRQNDENAFTRSEYSGSTAAPSETSVPRNHSPVVRDEDGSYESTPLPRSRLRSGASDRVTLSTTESPVLRYPSTTYHPKAKIPNIRNTIRSEPPPTTYSPRSHYRLAANAVSSVPSSSPSTSTSHENEVSPTDENPLDTDTRYQDAPIFRATVEHAADYFVPNSTLNNPTSKDKESNEAPSALEVKEHMLRLRPTTASPDSLSTPGISRGSARGRGKATFTTASSPETGNRGTPSSIARGSRPTLKPSTSIVSKAQEFIDIYKFPPSRPESVYPTPTPDKSAAKCRKDVCLLPDCNCGGKDIPGDLEPEQVPQMVLLTFDDAVNDLNKGLYQDLFEKGRTNPNGCPIAATFYVSHEWTDYSQVQNLYADGHEMASHSVSHSFGEQFSQKKWTKEIAGQREILAAYGGVKQEDIRGMRAPFLAVGGNKMFKMLYDSNFTYDSSMPVYENKPPSWPYTLDYKLFHDCMIPPCPTRSYPGVWEVPMVMWTDLNGGRCSMGDACSNPPTADGVYKMLIKNFERHYTTNRAPFGLFYHAAWFTQPHHKEGFIAFLDTLVSMNDVWLVTNWQALQWVRDPTPLSRISNFQPFQCNYQDRPRRCNNPKVCNLWHKSGVRYMRTCQPCPDVYPWTGKSGVRNSRVDNEIGTD